MTKLFSLASANGASLSGANLKAALTTLWSALSTTGITDSNRTTVTASASLLTTQCGILLVDCTSGSVVLTLPISGTSTDEARYRIRRIDATYANTLTVQRGGTDTIEGGTSSYSIGCGGELSFKMPGGDTNWRVTGRGGATTQAAREALGVPAVNWLDNPDGEVYQGTVAATADDTYMEDQWYALTQTGTVTPSQLTAPEDGFAYGIRVTQSQVTAQRFGEAQILEGKRTKKLRSKTMTWGGRFKFSAGANLRIAILAWTGTEDVVTSDVVNDWTNATYSAGSFFLAANLTVVAVSPSLAMTAGTARDASVTGVIPANSNNVIVMYWTEATAAQNVTLDAWGRRLVEGATLIDYIRRSEEHELSRCQRFFETGSYRFRVVDNGGTVVSTVAMKVRKRATPSITVSGGGTVTDIDASSFTIAQTAAGTVDTSFSGYTASARL